MKLYFPACIFVIYIHLGKWRRKHPIVWWYKAVMCTWRFPMIHKFIFKPCLVSWTSKIMFNTCYKLWSIDQSKSADLNAFYKRGLGTPDTWCYANTLFTSNDVAVSFWRDNDAITSVWPLGRQLNCSVIMLAQRRPLPLGQKSQDHTHNFLKFSHVSIKVHAVCTIM